VSCSGTVFSDSECVPHRSNLTLPDSLNGLSRVRPATVRKRNDCAHRNFRTFGAQTAGRIDHAAWISTDGRIRRQVASRVLLEQRPA